MLSLIDRARLASDQEARATNSVPTRPRPRTLRPHRIRTYLALFALALVLPLLFVSLAALDRMASVEEGQIQARVPQIASNLAAVIHKLTCARSAH